MCIKEDILDREVLMEKIKWTKKDIERFKEFNKKWRFVNGKVVEKPPKGKK